MSNSILPAAGNLDIVNANVRADKFNAATNIGVANTNPDFNFSVGDKFHVDKDSTDPVSITGNVVASGIKISNLTIGPAFDFASVSNVGNVTANVIQFANATTGFVTTANVEIGGNISFTSNAQVKVDSNVVAEYTGPHPRRKSPTIKKYPEINFRWENFDADEGDSSSNTYTQGGYQAISSSTAARSSLGDAGAISRAVWRLFDSFPSDGINIPTGEQYSFQGWTSVAGSYTSATGLPTGPTRFTGDQGEWVEIVMPKKIQLHRFSIRPAAGASTEEGARDLPDKARFPKVFAIHGYNGTAWTRLGEFTSQEVSGGDFSVQSFDIATPTSYYNKFVLVVKQTWSGSLGASYGTSSVTQFDEWKLFGIEEDAPAGDVSLDTTLKSVYNVPETTNYKMYFDGKDPDTGNVPKNLVNGSSLTVTPYNATFDTTNNCWTLDGSTESNVTTGDLGFEGDAPHTVSMWFNASNLENNTYTQQLFTLGSETRESKEIIRVDDTQIASNTWHNLTYAYEGRGGSKVTYLDGHKISEENAVDSFGAYPQIKMRGYDEEYGKIQGFTASASSTFNGYRIWEIFDGNNITGSGNEGAGAGWVSDIATGRPGYNASGVQQRNLSHHSGSALGEWVQLDMPHALFVDSLDIQSRAESGYAQGGTNWTGFPKNVYLYGSNDNSNWSLIKNFSTTSKDQGENYNEVINTTTAYKHFALVVNTTWVYGSGIQPHWTSIGQLRFYGHKEGDITRFPVPSRTVVYPQTGWPLITYEGYSGNDGSPINPAASLGLGDAGNAYRGVVVSASSRYDINQNQPYYAIRKDTGYKWASATGTYDSGNYAAVGSNLGTDNGGTAVAATGEWLMIELPRKIKLQHTLIISPDNANEVPDKFVIYGTNDLTGTWSVVDDTYQSTEANIGTGHEGKHWTVSTASGSNYYKYFGLVITHINGGATLTAIDQWELRGVESDTGVPAVVGGPFDGKIANFRVYDKFLGEERIKEIYDVDKDTFNHKTSSATFYRGRIGVGTTEPEGALAVLDEPPTLEKFPARALDANESYVEGQGYFKITNSIRGGDANTGFGTDDAATGSNEDQRQPRPGDNGYLAFGEDNVNHTTLDYNVWYPRAQIGAGSGVGNPPAYGQVGGRYKNFGEGWEEYLKRKKFISAPGHNTRMAEGVDYGAWLKMETPDTMLLKKAKIEASREWAMVGNSIRGDVRLDQLGEAVGINGDGTRVAVSSPHSGQNATNVSRGKVQVYEYDGWGWTPLGAAIEGDSGTGWYFGSAGCELNGKGDVLIVGTPLDGSGSQSNKGRVNVYYLKQSPSTGVRSWSAKGSPIYGPATDDGYGDGVAISEDGNIIAFGASGINNGSTLDCGGVLVYYWSTSTSAWVQRGTTLFGDEASRRFGGQGNVEMSSDGKYVIFGSRFSLDHDGKVMVWEFGGTNYSQRGSTLDGGTNRFGGSVGISDDGNTIVVGEHLDDAMGTDGGAIHVYNWNSGSSSYTLKQSLHHPTAADDQAGDHFGQFVCMSGDGKRIVAGSSKYPSTGANARGKLYTFEYDGNSWNLLQPWEMYGMIGERDDVPGDHGVGNSGAPTNDEGGTHSVYHGSHIAMTRDGSTVIFGMRRANMPNEEFAMRWGLAQVFQITSSIKSIWGSNDDRNWTKLTSTSKTFRSTDIAEYNNMNHTTYYKYHAIIGDAYTSLKKIEFYGIRGKSQSRLHDGELTLTKNLRVPRIGAPHDLDRTPKREHLLVEYNTSTNPMLNGKVIDSSGNEHHGYILGGIYDADAKCFTFNTGDTRHGGDATGRRKGAYDNLEGASYGDRLVSKVIHTGGRPNLSVSVWVNPKAIDAGSNSVWQLGTPGNTNAIGYRIDRRSQDGRYRHRVYIWDGQSIYRNFQINCHEWMHVVVVHHAHRFARDDPHAEGPWDLYVNGEYLSSGGTNSGSTISDLNLARNPVLALGSQVYSNQDLRGTNTSLHGSISNFKLYNCALDENDVKALYDMGRLDEGYDTVSMSKTRVGVGIGDGQAPTTGLDVRSGLRIPTQLTESGGYFMGKMRFNTVTQKLQVHNGNMWLSVGGNIAASGGNNIFTLQDQNAGGTGRLDSDGGRRYRVHAFTSSGTFTANGDLSNVDVLIVAGGGGGGTDNAGGGGAGGLILRPGMNIANGDHPIVVGSGGVGTSDQVNDAGSGNNSTAFGLTAIGGGRGLNGGTSSSNNNGGSGGGGDGERSDTSRGEAMQPGSDSNPAVLLKGGRPSGSAVTESALYGFGHPGGSRNNGGGGGGGGAGQPGGIGSGLTSGVGGEGGDGLYQVVNLPNYPGVWNFSDMFGGNYGHSANSQRYFAGGGGGGNNNDVTNDVAGGLGGGGAGRGSDANSDNGVANTGGGGGGGTYSGTASFRLGGAGGSGIVLIRYPL